MTTFTSSVSGKVFPVSEKISGFMISPNIVKLLRDIKPDFNDESCISVSEYKYYKQKYLQNYLAKDIGDFSQLEKEVIETIGDKGVISDRPDETDSDLTLGQRLSDRVASFGGSWKFIILFAIILFVWILFNSLMPDKDKFDPYPYILMNLVLSCIAAIQAPIIMMSQNRQEEKDRERAKQDYMVNLKSELEIRLLHEKLDHLIIDQQQELIKYQQTQIEKLNEILKK